MTREEEIADNGCSMQKCPINAFTFESCNLSKNECEYYTKSQEPCEDAISRQAAIDVMIKLEQDDIDRYGCKIPEGFDSSPAIEALDNLPSITSQPKAGQWIPVSKRLPEEETDVLICNRNGDIALSRGSYSTEVENDFIWYTSGWRFGKVIAWMPLPKPYRAESARTKND